MSTYPEGFADGVEYAARVVLKHMHDVLAAPRREPTDRRGKIVALGLLLQDLAPGMDISASGEVADDAGRSVAEGGREGMAGARLRSEAPRPKEGRATLR